VKANIDAKSEWSVRLGFPIASTVAFVLVKFGIVAFNGMSEFFYREANRVFGYTLDRNKEHLLTDLVDGMFHIDFLSNLQKCANGLDPTFHCDPRDAGETIAHLIIANALAFAGTMIIGHRLLDANKHSGTQRLLFFAGTAAVLNIAIVVLLRLFDGRFHEWLPTALLSLIPAFFGAFAGIVFLLVIHAFAPEQARLKSTPNQTTFGD
jgi:hypothetical protein